MSVSKKTVMAILKDIAKKSNLSAEEIDEIVDGRLNKVTSPFTPKALDLAKKNSVESSEIPHAGDKISIDDVRIFLGEAPKSKVSDLFTAGARKLAYPAGLKDSDFGDDERSGTPRKSGAIQITVKDVKAKLGLDSPKASTPKASPRALEVALENDIDITKVKGTGKDDRVLLSDIKDFITKKVDETPDSDSSDDENTDE